MNKEDSKNNNSPKWSILRTLQLSIWPITYIYFNSQYKIHIQGKENLEKIHNPFIIIANHFNFTISFIFRLVFGFFTPHLPLRFMAVNKFKRKWLIYLSNIGIIPFIYKMFGVIIVTPGLGMQKNLEESKQVIYGGGNILIYPEGGVAGGGVIAPFRNGAAVLASETGSLVLPVSFCLGKRRFIRHDLYVNIGEPINVPSDANSDETTKKFYDVITEQYQKSKTLNSA